MTATRQVRLELKLEPQPEGGYIVTSPTLPGLLTEGDTLDEVLANSQDAALATLELYSDQGIPWPDVFVDVCEESITMQALVKVPA